MLSVPFYRGAIVRQCCAIPLYSEPIKITMHTHAFANSNTQMNVSTSGNHTPQYSMQSWPVFYHFSSPVICVHFDHFSILSCHCSCSHFHAFHVRAIQIASVAPLICYPVNVSERSILVIVATN